MQSSVPPSSYSTSFSPTDLQAPRLSEQAASAISWSAIFGGVFVALAVSVVLTILGSGLGFAAKSPWVDASAAKTFGVVAVIWLIIIQWLGSALGGYITGRLRTRWVNVHMHEVFFRDTAHGFVTWAVATVLMLAIFTSLASVVGHAGSNITMHALSGYAKADEAAPGGPGHAPEGINPMAYYTDMLFRIDHTTTPTAVPENTSALTTPRESSEEVRGEANRILLRSLTDGAMSDEDKTYLTQLVQSRTGLTETDARKRVDDVIVRQNAATGKMKEVADNVRKTASVLSISMALSLIIGAFVASVAAALGGNIRDRHN